MVYCVSFAVYKGMQRPTPDIGHTTLWLPSPPLSNKLSWLLLEIDDDDDDDDRDDRGSV